MLIVGPPGSGKSTLLSDWAGRLDAESTAWATVREGDDTPEAFAQLLISVVGALNPESADRLVGADLTVAEGVDAWLDAVADERLADGGDRYVVIDDVHLLRHPVVRRILLWFVESVPPGLHVVMASRADPEMPLHRMRAQDDLLEIREADLRFSPEETAHFLDNAGLGSLAAEQVRLLDARTEGWAAGLQLAALSLRRVEDRDAFLRHFAGTQRHVADYLIHEVLDNQPEGVYWFLLRTSPFRLLTPGLCAAVTDVPQPLAFLELLEKEQLFVRRLSNDDNTFRYHELFRELLHFVLRSRHPKEEEQVLAAAAAWHESEGLHREAIDDRLAAGQVEAAVHLMEEHAETCFELGQVDLIRRWTQASDSLALQPDPLTVVGHAVRLGWADRWSEQGAVLERVEELLDVRDDDSARFVWAVTTALRRFAECEIVEAREQLMRVVGDRRRHMERRGGPALVAGAARRADLTLALAQALVGDIEGAREVAAECIRAYAGRPAAVVTARAVIVLCDVADGQILEAERRLATAMDEARALSQVSPDNSTSRILSFAAAWTSLERSQPEDALTTLGAQRPVGDRLDPVGLIIELGQIAAESAAGDVEDALAALCRMRRRCEEVTDPVVRCWLDAFEARLLLSTGRVQDAQKIAAELPAAPSLRYLGAELDLATGIVDEARSRYSQHDRDTPRERLEAAIIDVRADVTEGRPPERSSVDDIVRIGGHHGMVRAVLGGGAQLMDVLLDDVEASTSPFVADLREIWEGTPADFASSGAEAGLVVPLTERERQVLRYLATRLSIREIASELFLSVNTVKSHVQTIYRKLACNSRREAVDRARDLHLLSTT